MTETDGYGFPCDACGHMLLVVIGSPPFPPYQTTTKRITCSACGESHGYVGQMMRVTSASQP